MQTGADMIYEHTQINKSSLFSISLYNDACVYNILYYKIITARDKQVHKNI
jgi:hypothetical protein